MPEYQSLLKKIARKRRPSNDISGNPPLKRPCDENERYSDVQAGSNFENNRKRERGSELAGAPPFKRSCDGVKRDSCALGDLNLGKTRKRKGKEIREFEPKKRQHLEEKSSQPSMIKATPDVKKELKTQRQPQEVRSNEHPKPKKKPVPTGDRFLPSMDSLALHLSALNVSGHNDEFDQKPQEPSSAYRQLLIQTMTGSNSTKRGKGATPSSSSSNRFFKPQSEKKTSANNEAGTTRSNYCRYTNTVSI